MLPGGVQRWIPVVAVSLAVLPLGLLAVRVRTARLRERGLASEVAVRRSVAEVGTIGGTLPWLWMILTPLPAPRQVRPVPLLDIANLLAGAPLTAFFQIGGNLLVFAAFGLLAPVRWRIGAVAVTAIAAAGSVTVESLQYALNLGRVSSVDDVLLNAAGAGLAALLSRRWLRRRVPAVAA
jgi:hypothetical protein